MNRTFKTIWSERANCFVAVSECTKGRGKRGALVRTAVALALAGAATASLADPAPAPATFDGVDADISGQAFGSTNGSTGVLGTNGAQITGSNVTIDVTGSNGLANSPGALKITRGSSAVLSDITITTDSYDAAGMRADIDANTSPTATQDASITATNASITTSGDHSHGAQALSVDGKDANSTLTLDGGSITTHGDNSFGLHSVGEHSTLTSSANVTTTGNTGFGAFAEDKAKIILNGGTIHTTGGISGGVASLGLIAIDGAQITGTANVTTDGAKATGVQAETGAHIDLTDSVIQTNGNSADGVLAKTGASVVLTGGSVTTAATGDPKGTNTGVEVRSYALSADGADSTVTTNNTAVHAVGQRSYGAYATHGGAITLNDGSVQTEGFMGYGVRAEGDGSSVTTNRTNISTSGQSGDAVWAYDGGVVNLNGGTIQVTGQPNPQSPGERANGLVAVGGGYLDGSRVMNAGVINAQGITLTTTGANSVGALAGATILDTETSGTINLTDSSITVTGANSNAADVGYGSTLNASNSSLVSTQGVGISLDEAANVTLNNTVVQAGQQSIYSTLSEAGKSQSITIGSGSVLTKNNGTLLQVDRSAQGGGAVKLDLQDGSTASGDIIDNLNGVVLDSDGGTYVTVGSEASFSGKVTGVRDFRTEAGTSGQTLTFDSGSQLGSLYISGDNTSTHGGTRDAPILASGDITVDNNAVFGGNWKIDGTLTSTNGGVIQPGNSVGTVSAGQINWGAGTVYNAEVNAAGDSDLVNVTAGDADLSHTALHVSEENGNGGIKLNHDYKILTATGAITPFESAEFNGAPLIAATPNYSPNLVTVRLGVNQDALSAMDLSHNQRAAATGAMSVVGANASADAAFLSDNPASAFDQLSGEVHASVKSALMASADLLPNTISQRLRGDLDTDVRDGGQGGGTPLWAQVVGNWQTLDGKNGTADIDQDVYGLFLGGDTTLGAGWRLGGVFGYTNSDIDVDGRSSSADVDSYTVGLYTGNSWAAGSGRINLMLGGGYTLHDIDTHRSVSIGGNQTLRSSYDGDTAQVFGELGYELPVSHAASIEPYLRLAYLNQHTDSFDEDGGSAALRGSSSNEDTTSTTLGVHGKMAFDYRGKPVTLRASAGWRHAFGNLTPSSEQAFIQGGGTSFSVDGAPIAENAAVIGLGAEIPIGRSNTVGVSYGGQFGDGNSDNSGNIYLKARF